MENTVDYRRLLPSCIPHMLKRELRKAAVAAGLLDDNAVLRGMKAEALKNYIIQNATLEQAEFIRNLYPNYFNFTCKEANKAFGYNLSSGQAEYLARQKKIRIIGQNKNGSGLTCNLYAPEEFFSLTQEDLNCPDSPDWVNQQMLIDNFGWTKALIRRFLPNPKLVTNPRYRTAPDMKVWHILDIEAIMASPEYSNAVEMAKLAKKAAKKASDRRRSQAITEMDAKIESIQVDVIPDKELRQAILTSMQEQLNKAAPERGGVLVSAREADEEAIGQWVVDYIRENLMDYDYSLYRCMGKAGCIRDHERYRNAVLDKIAEAYPAYADECERRKRSPL